MTDDTNQQLVGRCIGCFHDFTTGPCGGCGAVDRPSPEFLPRSHVPVPAWWFVMTGSPQTEQRDLKPGMKVSIKHQPTLGGEAIVYRVMAVAQGWAMLRYP